MNLLLPKKLKPESILLFSFSGLRLFPLNHIVSKIICQSRTSKPQFQVKKIKKKKILGEIAGRIALLQIPFESVFPILI